MGHLAGQHHTTRRQRVGVASGLVSIALGTMLSLFAFAPAALGAGTGYGGTGGTGTGTGTGSPTTPSGFTTVLTTQTVQPSGGTVTAGGVTVTVPAGDVTSPIQVIITQGTISGLTGLPAGSNPILAYGVTFVQNGQKYHGTFPAPITVTISNPAITTADQVLVYSDATGTYVPLSSDPIIENIVVSNGSISFQVLSDPFLVITGPLAAAAAIPNATVAVTGVPTLTEGILGGVLVMLGLMLGLQLRARRRRLRF